MKTLQRPAAEPACGSRRSLYSDSTAGRFILDSHNASSDRCENKKADRILRG